MPTRLYGSHLAAIVALLVAATACSCSGQGTLTPLPGTESLAFAINDKGQAAGVFWTGQAQQACVWTDGSRTDLGDLGGGYSRANAINNSGQVVGDATVLSTSWSPPTHAFLWSDGRMIDLGSPGGVGD